MTSATPQDSSARDRIVDAARALITTRSYASVGVAEICAAAGVKKGSFYHFFPSKQDLGLAVLEAYRREQGVLLQEVVRDTKTPPLERIGRIVAAIAEMQEDGFRESGRLPGCPFGNIAAELSTQDDVIRARVEQVFEGFESHLERLLREAVDRGDIAPLNTEATAQAMFAFLEGAILSAKTRNDPSLLKRVAPAVTSLRVP